MIWNWLIAAFIFVVKLIIPARYWPKPYTPPKVDPNAPCPGCGNTKGSISIKKLPTNVFVIMHMCSVCKAEWHEPVVHDGRLIIHAPSAATPAKK